jgi:hypothetical protein
LAGTGGWIRISARTREGFRELEDRIAGFLERETSEEGEQITKLTIITKHTIVDYLLTGITLTIYSPMTVTVKGSIARI